MLSRRDRKPVPLDDRARARLEALLLADRPTVAKAPPPGQETDSPAPGLEISRRLRAFGLAHFRAVALVAAGALALACFFVLRARPVAADVRIEASPAAVTPVTDTSTPSPSPLIRVHVLGAVASPGVITLPEGARVADALGAAGGLNANANPGELNLAALVPDGAQLVIGTKASPRGELRASVAGAAGGSVSAGSSAASLLNLNTATAEQLDGLPGVGPVTAQAILSWRAQHGRFNSVAELQEVDGIGPKTYAELAPRVRV